MRNGWKASREVVDVRRKSGSVLSFLPCLAVVVVVTLLCICPAVATDDGVSVDVNGAAADEELLNSKSNDSMIRRRREYELTNEDGSLTTVRVNINKFTLTVSPTDVELSSDDANGIKNIAEDVIDEYMQGIRDWGGNNTLQYVRLRSLEGWILVSGNTRGRLRQRREMQEQSQQLQTARLLPSLSYSVLTVQGGVVSFNAPDPYIYPVPTEAQIEALTQDALQGEFLAKLQSESFTHFQQAFYSLATASPIASPTNWPSAVPTASPTSSPTDRITAIPTASPTSSPTNQITEVPTASPMASPTDPVTEVPTASPMASPTDPLTEVPTASPVASPTDPITEVPTASPVASPTNTITDVPTASPTRTPSTQKAESQSPVPSRSPTSDDKAAAPAPPNTPSPSPHTPPSTAAPSTDNDNVTDLQGSPLDGSNRRGVGTAPLIGAAAGGIAIVGVVVFFLVRRRRRKASFWMPDAKNNTFDEDLESDPSNMKGAKRANLKLHARDALNTTDDNSDADSIAMIGAVLAAAAAKSEALCKGSNKTGTATPTSSPENTQPSSPVSEWGSETEFNSGHSTNNCTDFDDSFERQRESPTLVLERDMLQQTNHLSSTNKYSTQVDHFNVYNGGNDLYDGDDPCLNNHYGKQHLTNPPKCSPDRLMHTPLHSHQQPQPQLRFEHTLPPPAHLPKTMVASPSPSAAVADLLSSPVEGDNLSVSSSRASDFINLEFEPDDAWDPDDNDCSDSDASSAHDPFETTVTTIPSVSSTYDSDEVRLVRSGGSDAGSSTTSSDVLRHLGGRIIPYQMEFIDSPPSSIWPVRPPRQNQQSHSSRSRSRSAPPQSKQLSSLAAFESFQSTRKGRDNEMNDWHGEKRRTSSPSRLLIV